MIRKFPIIHPSVKAGDILVSACSRMPHGSDHDFIRALAEFCRSQDIFLLDSGIAAFYLILLALRESSSRTEVVLPAYTAGSLVVAVRKAGLKPVLCDVSLDDFNADAKSLLNAITSHTLSAVAIHMFGIPVHDIAHLRQTLPPGVFLLEDCCQSMGARVVDTACGCFGDISFFSFNRGKNLSTFGGGCIAVNQEGLTAGIRKQIDLFARNRPAGLLLPLTALVYLSALNPVVYGLAHGVISRFKENAPPDDITVGALSGFQIKLGTRLIARAQDAFLQRHKNGMYLLKGLEGLEFLMLPRLREEVFPVFNRLPVLCRDTQELAGIQKRLWDAGFESSRMYEKPLHQMFDLGYKKGDFPNSFFLAGHLLTLPVYAGSDIRYCDAMIAAIRG